MSLIIVTTVAGSASNSYISLADAETYMAPRLESKWASETDDEVKKSVLILATRMLDSLQWRGDKMYTWPEGHASYQALQWPRRGNRLEDYTNGDLPYSYDSDNTLIIPKCIREATVEQAEFLLVGESGELSRRDRLRRQGVKQFSVPGLAETLGGRSQDSQIAPVVLRMLRQYMVIADNRVYRG